MLAYWDDEAKTKDTFTDDHFLKTGYTHPFCCRFFRFKIILVCFSSDLVEMNEQGYLQFRGRLKDMVIRGGENIYPREIEDLLHQHTKVNAPPTRYLLC
jgi:acyl-CoA synthetase (AMP-forming)/AMP-acid ligase II